MGRIINRLTEESLLEHRSVGVIMESEESAKELAGKFPKYCKVEAEKMSGHDFSKPSGKTHYTKDIVSLSIWVKTDKRTGAANEAAEKRRNKILEIVRTL